MGDSIACASAASKVLLMYCENKCPQLADVCPKASSLPVVFLVMVALVSSVNAQFGSFACCSAGGNVTYAHGPAGCNPTQNPGVATWSDVSACWEASKRYFANKGRS